MTSSDERSRQSQLGGDLVEGEDKANTPLKWITPVAEAVGGFNLDPCASMTSDLADCNIREDGGLAHDWGDYETIWVNHPFSDPGPWLEKAAGCDAELVVTLSKADPSTHWFHEHSLRADLLAFPNDRVNFIGYEWDAAFPVVYGVYGHPPDSLVSWFESIGWVVQPEREIATTGGEQR